LHLDVGIHPPLNPDFFTHTAVHDSHEVTQEQKETLSRRNDEVSFPSYYFLLNIFIYHEETVEEKPKSVFA
jgi:hypothetical protein